MLAVSSSSCEDVADLDRMDEVGLAGVAELRAVLPGGEDVGPAQKVGVGGGVVRLHPVQDVLEPPYHALSLSVKRGL